MFKKFEEIDAWKRARKLVKEIYQITASGAFDKDWGLKDQIRRAAVSICSNIAEGYGRSGNAEFIRFLWIAKGSAAEVQSQLYHAYDLKYVTREISKAMYETIGLISAEIFSLIKALSASATLKKSNDRFLKKGGVP